jgi:uncharacterized protein with ParB-like and HNH nuclease domain
MAIKFETEKEPIRQIFKKWYRIPQYQRPYVWQKDNVIQLLEDINDSYENDKNSEYFLGSIVYQKRKEDNCEENDILDGQQRLITIFLIIAVIRDLTENEKLIEKCQSYLYQQKDDFEKISERLRIIFDIRLEVKDFIDKYIKPKQGTLNENIKYEQKDISVKNMVNAILTIKEFFKQEKFIQQKEKISDFFSYLITQVNIIYISSENLGDAFKLFTVINNRGLKLRTSDILKAQNLGALGNNQKDVKYYSEEWEKIENDIDNFDEFLSHIRTIILKDKARLNLLDEFDKNIYQQNKLQKGKESFKLIKKYKQYYDELFEYSDKWSYDFYNRIIVMNIAPSNIWKPVLLKYYDKFQKENILKFFQKLESKFFYDWITSVSPTKRIENMNAIIKKIEDINNSADLLNLELFKIDIEKLKELISEDIYEKKYAKYLLFKLDYIYGHNKEQKIEKNLNVISIEHILPQNPENNSKWAQDFNEEARIKWTHKIGNLILLGKKKNSSFNNSEYLIKKEKYFNRNIETFPYSLKVLKNDKWTIEELEKNHNENIDNLIEYFSGVLEK